MTVDPTLAQLPLTLLTGFLGSGKTTLLRRALSAPEFADTAVVINEVGAVAIDHYLVDFALGDVVELPGGCLCCAVREDLAATLRNLVERRDTGDIRAFRRIVVETSGLADPGPILFTLGTDAMLDRRLRLCRAATVIDAVAGAAALDRFAEAARQAAIADVLIVSKTDLAPFSPALAARLEALNPAARRIIGTGAADPAGVLFPADTGARQPMSIMPGPDRGIHGTTAAIPGVAGGRVRPGHDDDGYEHAAHTHGIATYTVVLDGPLGRFDFARALGGLAQARGYDLLRVKGIVAFADAPGRPAVVQAAQHAMFAPEWLDGWPDDDRRSRLVFIVHDIAPAEILAHFAFANPHLVGLTA
ncbi:MAG TPA: GTP-binding protein [Stellaceae bacterium]|nr:GTP-binding protein [Stellaceae bacterium]